MYRFRECETKQGSKLRENFQYFLISCLFLQFKSKRLIHSIFFRKDLKKSMKRKRQKIKQSEIHPRDTYITHIISCFHHFAIKYIKIAFFLCLLFIILVNTVEFKKMALILTLLIYILLSFMCMIIHQSKMPEVETIPLTATKNFLYKYFCQ